MQTTDDVRPEYHGRVRTEVLALVPDGVKSVLDVGGGIGTSVKYLKSQEKATYGVVVDLVGNECVPEVDAAYGGNLEDPALLAQVAEEQGPFDCILCLDVLEHVTDPWAVVASCHKMLAPGGTIVASIPNMRHTSLVLPLVFKGQFSLEDSGIRDRTHLRWFVKESSIALMTSSGLTLDHVQGQYYGRKNVLFDKATLGFFKDFLHLQHFIRVRRND